MSPPSCSLQLAVRPTPTPPPLATSASASARPRPRLLSGAPRFPVVSLLLFISTAAPCLAPAATAAPTASAVPALIPPADATSGPLLVTGAFCAGGHPGDGKVTGDPSPSPTSLASPGPSEGLYSLYLTNSSDGAGPSHFVTCPESADTLANPEAIIPSTSTVPTTTATDQMMTTTKTTTTTTTQTTPTTDAFEQQMTTLLHDLHGPEIVSSTGPASLGEWEGFSDSGDELTADAREENNSSKEMLSPSQTLLLKPLPEKRFWARLAPSPTALEMPAPSAAAVVRGPRRESYDSRVTILGLFELTASRHERPEGRSELAAALMAVRRINQMGVIKGYTLELIHNDTKCDPGAGVDALFHALYALRYRVMLLLGAACEDVSESLAKVVPYWNIVQMSFGSTSPLLSDRREFPLFARTAAPQSSHDAARTALLRAFGWDSVAALSQDRDIHSLAVNSLVTALEAANISCRASVTFAENDFDDQLTLLKDLDTRIILGSFSREVAPKIFCKALGLGVVGEDYAWVLQGSPEDSWWSPDFPCEFSSSGSMGSIQDAVEGLLLVSSYGRSLGDTPSESGLTYADFLRTVRQEDPGVPVSELAAQTYDAVWALALALRNAQRVWAAAGTPRLHHFHYDRADMAAEFLKQMAALNFTGVSGPVSFRQADRIGISLISQVQDGVARPVALFHPSWGALEWLGAVRWAGGHTPVSRRVCVARVITVRTEAFLAVTCLAALGILLAVCCLAFNLHYRRLKYIKMSSPRLNNMAAVGCVLVYGAVILLGVDHATLPDGAPYSAVCTARVYLLSAGFSLAFGSMFTKTYRVHRIFTMSYGCYGGSKKKLLQDTQLMSLVGALLLLDVFVVTLWATVDPMGRHLHNLTLEISPTDRGVVYQTQVEVCKSQHTRTWLGALYVYKGLLLLVGLYMAWETRRVKIPALNDSHYIGLSVYSVVVCSGLSVVLASLLWESVTVAYVCSTALVLVSTTATLCLLFLPKLHAMNRRQDVGTDPVGQSMGLRLECNTRRFVVDEGQELRYRVQVQNRVYRRELAALQAEALRLEQQLESPSVAVSSASVSLGDESEAVSGLSAREDLYAAHPLAPLLLLAVLPPVTPRASWPSAAPERPRAASTQQAFQSEPQLEPAPSDNNSADPHHYLRRETFAGTSSKQGVLGRFFNLFSGRHAGLDNRGNSTGSISGITSALRAHMGYIANLVPSAAGSKRDRNADSGTSSPSSSRGTSRLHIAPHIAVLAAEDQENKRKFSLAAMCVLSRSAGDAEDEGGVSPSSKFRVKGSPRFPHRVVPLGSEHGGDSGRLAAAPTSSGSGSASGSLRPLAGARCRSLEDARRSSTGTPNYRAISLSPNCDVWAIKERGITFADFAIREKFLRAQREQELERQQQEQEQAQQEQQQYQEQQQQDLNQEQELHREQDLHLEQELEQQTQQPK